MFSPISLYAMLAVFLATASLGAAIEGWRVDSVRAEDHKECQQAQDALQQALTSQFNAAKQAGEANGNDNQTKHSTLDSKLTDSVRQPAKCIPVRAAAPPAVSGDPAPAGLLVPDAGVSGYALQYYARDAQGVNIDLESCKAFVAAIYKGNGL